MNIQQNRFLNQLLSELNGISELAGPILDDGDVVVYRRPGKNEGISAELLRTFGFRANESVARLSSAKAAWLALAPNLDNVSRAWLTRVDGDARILVLQPQTGGNLLINLGVDGFYFEPGSLDAERAS